MVTCGESKVKQSKEKEVYAQKLYQDLLKIYGPFIASKHLPAVLAYPSELAFRQAIVRKTIPVKLFTIDNRRGKFARTEDVATWASQVSKNNLEENKNELV